MSVENQIFQTWLWLFKLPEQRKFEKLQNNKLKIPNAKPTDLTYKSKEQQQVLSFICMTKNVYSIAKAWNLNKGNKTKFAEQT